MREVGGVEVARVPAVHSNGISPALLEGDLAERLATNGLTAYIGPPGGYVLQFSNGLVVYLSGDTGITAEQEAVVQRFFGANLAVMNIGGIFSTGPTEAAWVINELVKPSTAIASHANELATVNGEVQPGTRTAASIEAVSVPVPLSGRAMELDGKASCVSGCRRPGVSQRQAPEIRGPSPAQPAGIRNLGSALGGPATVVMRAAAQSRVSSVESVTAQSAMKVKIAFAACAYSHCRRSSCQFAGTSVQLLVA